MASLGWDGIAYFSRQMGRDSHSEGNPIVSNSSMLLVSAKRFTRFGNLVSGL